MSGAAGPEPASAASARILTAIGDKRAGAALAPEVIGDLVGDYVAGRIPDYQMAAWLATVACRGLDAAETAALTRAYVDGGARLGLGGGERVVLDKHSTGGVGDKVSLVVVPTVAACGYAVAKMSGRGLGHAGGTLDKLESIPGLRLDLGAQQVRATLAEVGMVITGQSAELAPGDGATYALRDVTSTVESIPLIAASIIGKKVAVGADGLVLDVKTGSGALMPSLSGARELAAAMLALAAEFGLRSRAVISDMSQPLGHAVGNALEVKEALAVLRGREVPGLSAVSAVLSRLMLQSADPALTDEQADARVRAVLADGSAYERFVRWAGAQGADTRVLEEPERLPSSAERRIVAADRDGWVAAVDPRAIGTAALRVGAGRLRQDARLDYGAGVMVLRRVGDPVSAGEALAEIHHAAAADHETAFRLARSAFTVSPERPVPPPVVHEVM